MKSFKRNVKENRKQIKVNINHDIPKLFSQEKQHILIVLMTFFFFLHPRFVNKTSRK